MITRERLQHKLDRVNKIIKDMDNYNSDSHNFHGGKSLGYYEGKRAVLEDLLDDLENKD